VRKSFAEIVAPSVAASLVLVLPVPPVEVAAGDAELPSACATDVI
jgi:hypothetical protein